MPRADKADTFILHSCRGQGQASSSWWTRMTSLHPHSIISWAVLITCPWKRNGGGELLNTRRHQISLGTVTFSPATEGQRRQCISRPVTSIQAPTAAQLSQLWASLFNYCCFMIPSFMVLGIKCRTSDMLGNHSIPLSHGAQPLNPF